MSLSIVFVWITVFVADFYCGLYVYKLNLAPLHESEDMGIREYENRIHKLVKPDSLQHRLCVINGTVQSKNDAITSPDGVNIRGCVTCFCNLLAQL